MAQEKLARKLGEIAQIIGGELRGNPETIIHRPVPVGTNDETGITFAGNEKYIKTALGSTIGAVLVPKECPELPMSTIACDNPRASFGIVLALFDRTPKVAQGVHPTAFVSPTANVDPAACIGAFVFVGEYAEIGAGASIHAGCSIGDRSSVGDRTIIFPNVSVGHDVQIGQRCIIHSGTVLGSDGFGFAFNGEEHVKIPQIGGIKIGDRVEIGGNCVIDRATCGDTVLGDGTKLDNLVHIAHNTIIGKNVIIAGLCGISGSCEIGDNCVMGGQVGIADHVKIVAGTMIGGGSGIISDITEPTAVFGYPSMPHKAALRSFAVYRQLPELAKRVRELEKKGQE